MENQMVERTSYDFGEPIWVDLGTPDLEASIAFYGALFGWDAARGPAEVGGYTMFTLGGRNVAGAGPLMTEGLPPAWSCYVSVEDADASAVAAQQHGGQLVVAPMGVTDAGRMAIFTDPTGAAISVWQPRLHSGADLQGEEGTLAWIELASRDQEAALPFYAAVFGWAAERQEGYTEFELKGRSVAGCINMPPMVPAAVPSYWMPYFAASDPAAAAQRAAGLGGTILVPFMEAGRVAFSVVQDPHDATSAS
jgi:predicted enzyme related to lactoylglutathione lyase